MCVLKLSFSFNINDTLLKLKIISVILFIKGKAYSDGRAVITKPAPQIDANRSCEPTGKLAFTSITKGNVEVDSEAR